MTTLTLELMENLLDKKFEEKLSPINNRLESLEYELHRQNRNMYEGMERLERSVDAIVALPLISDLTLRNAPRLRTISGSQLRRRN